MSNEKVARFNKQHYVVGLKETLKALKKDQVTSLIIAQDVEVHHYDSRVKLYQSKNIPLLFSKQRALGEYVGITLMQRLLRY